LADAQKEATANLAGGTSCDHRLCLPSWVDLCVCV
jgi:hypothetical protein